MPAAGWADAPTRFFNKSYVMHRAQVDNARTIVLMAIGDDANVHAASRNGMRFTTSRGGTYANGQVSINAVEIA